MTNKRRKDGGLYKLRHSFIDCHGKGAEVMGCKHKWSALKACAYEQDGKDYSAYACHCDKCGGDYVEPSQWHEKEGGK